jgi:hypothetical protein
MTSATLWPPKPNELFRAAMSPCGQCRCSPRTTSRSICRVEVVEVDRRRSDAVVHGQDRQDPSSAPAAPSRCPVIDLVALTAIPSAAAPKARRIALASATSPTGVEVACALMWTTSASAEPGRLDRLQHGAGRAGALGLGSGDVVGIGGHPDRPANSA